MEIADKHRVRKRDLNLLKRYWVFAYDPYESYGGLNDVQATSYTYKEAYQIALNTSCEIVYILDKQTARESYIKGESFIRFEDQ